MSKDGLIPGHAGMPMRKMNAQRWAKMMRLLVTGEHTIPELAVAINISEPSVWEYITELRKVRPRLIRVADWRNTRAGIRPLWVAAYSWGSEPDVKRPEKKSGAERCREYRQRKRTSAIAAALTVQWGGNHGG